MIGLLPRTSANKLLVFSDDWGRHPSSCQHLIGKLLPARQVTWVNTIGMRPPRWDRVTIQRGFEKMTGWMQGRASSAAQRMQTFPEPLQLIDAKMWPWMTHRWDRWLNQRLLQRQLMTAAEDAIAVTTIPLVADLIGRLPVRRWVYYCVDDFSVWPGLDHRAVGTLETRLIERVDGVVAASENLQARVREIRPDCSLLTHGVDLAHWQDAHPVDWQAEGIEAPVYLFWGVIDQRMDVAFLQRLGQMMTKGTILLVGPAQNPDPRLDAVPRLRQWGAVPYCELPSLAAAADVLIMPYIDAAVTRAMQPLKMKEYLATGLPLVARRLPALWRWETNAALVDDAEDFAAQVLAAGKPSHLLAGGLPLDLAQESWEAKAERFCEVLDQEGKR